GVWRNRIEAACAAPAQTTLATRQTTGIGGMCIRVGPSQEEEAMVPRSPSRCQSRKATDPAEKDGLVTRLVAVRPPLERLPGGPGLVGLDVAKPHQRVDVRMSRGRVPVRRRLSPAFAQRVRRSVRLAEV